MSSSWTASSTVIANQNVVACELEGDSVLLDLESSRYFRLNKVGSHVWTALVAPQTVQQLRDHVLNGFDVDAERCACDLDSLLTGLSGAGLIEISDSPAG